MSEELEKILDQAISQLNAGANFNAVLDQYPAQLEELAPLLEVAKMGLHLPKNFIPEPAMQRKFMLAAAKQPGFLAWLRLPRFASVSLIILTILGAFAGTTFAALGSVPGQNLFAVKKAFESVEIALATSPQQKANLQLTFADRRVAETEKILKDPNHTSAVEVAALTELSNQTNNALADVKSAAATNAVNNDPNILNSLNSLVSNQQALLNQIKPASSTAALAKQSQGQVAELKKVISSIAAVSADQTLAKLDPNPNVVIVSGILDNLYTNQIIVEKTVFQLSAGTVISDAQGNTLNASALALNEKVTVTGEKTSNNLVANEIIILTNLPPQNNPKPSTTPNSLDKDTKTITVPPTSTNINLNLPHPTEETTTPAASDPNTAVGTFIFENPAPQFAP